MRAKTHVLMALASVGLLLTGCGASGDEADGEPADEAVEDLRTMFTEGSTLREGRPLSTLVELVDLTSEGSVAVASLDAVQDRAPHVLPHLLMSRDVPFVHRVTFAARGPHR